MRVDSGAPAGEPRWLAAVWIWLPALAGMIVFGAAATLQLRDGGSVSWWVLGGLLCAGAYALRERWPVVALAACLLVVAGSRWPGADVRGSVFGAAYLLLVFVPVLPLIAVATRLATRSSAVALVATVVVTVGVSPDPVWSTPSSSAQAELVGYVLNVGLPVAIALGAWLAGCATRARRRYVEAMLQRAVSLDLVRAAETARAVAEERASIARELHDVVTHTVAVMVVQASAADAVWDSDPEQARSSVRAVEESGRTAMADLRGMLGAMRRDDDAGEWQARAGVEQLPALLEQVRTTGVSADLRVQGPAEDLAPVVSLALLRIAQESVTNALRHAHASAVSIDLEVSGETIRLSVADDGIGYDTRGARSDALDPQRAGGHGIAGMRERAKAISATFDISPGPEHGTVVSVCAPRRERGLA